LIFAYLEGALSHGTNLFFKIYFATEFENCKKKKHNCPAICPVNGGNQVICVELLGKYSRKSKAVRSPKSGGIFF